MDGMEGWEPGWDAQKMLDWYIYDYMKSRNMNNVAEDFAREAEVHDPPPVDQGYLNDWWLIFWASYTARNNLPPPAMPNSVMEYVAGAVQVPNVTQQVGPSNQSSPQVPFGADLGSMMMGQQPAANLLTANANQLAPASAQPTPELQEQAASSAQQIRDIIMLAQQNQQQAPPNVNRQGISLGRPSTPNTARYGGLPRANQQMISSDAGKNKGKGIMMPSLSRAQPTNAFGNSSNLTVNQILSSFSANPLQGNTHNAQNVMLGMEGSSGQAFGNLSNLMGNQLPNSISANPVEGSSSAAQNVMFGNEDPSGGAFDQILNSLAAGSTQQNTFSSNQQPESSNLSARMPASPQGITGRPQIPILANKHSGGLAFGSSSNSISAVGPQQGSTNSAQNVIYIDGEEQETSQQAFDKLMNSFAAEQNSQNSAQNSDGQVTKKKRISSTALEGENSLGGDKHANEDVDSFLVQGAADVDAYESGNLFSTLQIGSSGTNNTGNQGFSLQEINNFDMSKAKVLCCDFSSDGKYLASAGHEKKVIIYNMETPAHEVTMEGHSNIITDVRFKPISTVLATSSFDKTVQLWDVPKTKSLLTLNGHHEHVMSVDFHPLRQDLLCSCDSNKEIRLWDVNQNAVMFVFKGASRQVRYQPQTGNLLAAASGNSVSLIDDTRKPQFKLEGHVNEIRSICWDPTGEYLASVSEDSARIWSIVAGGKCVYEMKANGNKFESCTFHPGHTQVLVIGSYQILDVWDPVKGDETASIQAHEGIISSLADSPLTELIASVSHDQKVKVWK